MSVLFKPTAKCPKRPDNRGRGPLRKPCPDLSDEDVDTCLEFMLQHGASDMMLPLSQYGRRIAVEAHLLYERIIPVSQEHRPWTPNRPVQPR